MTDIFAEAPIVHKKMGLVVKPDNPKQLADSILYLLKNEDIAKKYGETGYKFIEKHRTWDKIAKKMYSIFCKYVKNRRS